MDKSLPHHVTTVNFQDWWPTPCSPVFSCVCVCVFFFFCGGGADIVKWLSIWGLRLVSFLPCAPLSNIKEETRDSARVVLLRCLVFVHPCCSGVVTQGHPADPASPRTSGFGFLHIPSASTTTRQAREVVPKVHLLTQALVNVIQKYVDIGAIICHYN